MNNISDNCVISVIGDHGGGKIENIFERKIRDIEINGYTFWALKSHKANPKMVQELCSSDESDHLVYFIEPSSKNGSMPTKFSVCSKEYSIDKTKWMKLPDGITEVSAKLDPFAYALVLDKIYKTKMVLDIWDYVDAFNVSRPVKLRMGCSTLCAVKCPEDSMDCSGKMVARHRNVVAIGRLKFPYGVYIR